MSLAASALLAASGVLAGVVGTAGGITSLVSYPALLAAGVAPLPADVANLVAFVACLPGSTLASRNELRGSGRSLRIGLPLSVAGAAAGSLLLLTTPSSVFDWLVPFLVLAGSAALVAQPRLARRYRTASGPITPFVLIGIVSVYGGYFGAGSGVLTLAVLMILVDERLPHANAVKNVLVGAGAIASAAIFVAAGPVAWRAVVPLATGLFAGALLGPVVARRVPAVAVRWTVAALGVALAVELWVRAAGR
jgi:uncharacterized membrane protein YfcA